MPVNTADILDDESRDLGEKFVIACRACRSSDIVFTRIGFVVITIALVCKQCGEEVEIIEIDSDYRE